MILEIFLAVIGFIFLVKGADFLVEGASFIAKKFKIPEIIIGLTIVSIGTSLPELFVSVTSAIEGFADISIGNVVGSNICNLLLILGICAIIRPVEFKKETKLIEIPIALFTTFIFTYMCNTNNLISRKEGIILLVLCLVFIIYTIVMSKKGNKFDKIDDSIITLDENEKKMSLLKSIMYILVGIVALKFGADFVVNNCEKIAKALSISDKIIGLTIIAVGTSLPELVTSVVATKKGDDDIAIGNIIGSNIFNILLIIGISAVISPVSYSISYNIQLVILIISTILLGLFPFIKPKDKMTKENGIIYILMYISYLLILLFRR